MNEKPKKLAKVIPLHQPLAIEILDYEQIDYENWDIYIRVNDEPMILEDVSLVKVDGTRIEFGCDNVLHNTQLKSQKSICKHCQKPYSHPVCQTLNKKLNEILQHTLSGEFPLQLLAEAYQYENQDELDKDIELTKKSIKLVYLGEDGENVVAVLRYENDPYLFVDSLSEEEEDVPPMFMKYDDEIGELGLALELMNPVVIGAAVDIVTEVFTDKPENIDYIEGKSLKEIFLAYAYNK